MNESVGSDNEISVYLEVIEKKLYKTVCYDISKYISSVSLLFKTERIDCMLIAFYDFDTLNRFRRIFRMPKIHFWHDWRSSRFYTKILISVGIKDIPNFRITNK